MKRGVFILLFILLVTPFVLGDTDESIQIPKAYKCLSDKLGTSCSSSLEDNIFSLLAIGECESQVISSAMSDNECWPSSGCKIKTTAQAVLALESSGVDTTNAEDWLLTKTRTPENLIWYLEIESPETTTCKITYNGVSYNIDIKDDKTLSSKAGACLSLSEEKYWLKIASSCYDTDFEISCDEQFLTTLLYKKESSSTIYVSESTSSSSADGTTQEKVSFECLSTSGSCDYEGTLWAALVLDYLYHDVSSFIPYLVTMADENQELIPEAFLYFITGSSELQDAVLSKQKNAYWDESGNQFYDTAVALLPFQDASPGAKEEAQNWLLENQGSDGCWNNGNIRDTAFILYSIWPDTYSYPEDCEDMGYFCMEESSCSGEVIEQYTCSGSLVCCSREEPNNTCSSKSGEICSSDEFCSDGTTVNSSDLEEDEVCCIDGGTCETDTRENCTEAGYFCMSGSSCTGDILIDDYYCANPFVCCSEKSSENSCENQGGVVCGSSQFCYDGKKINASDLGYGEVCCVNGTCLEDTCSNHDGTICLSDEFCSDGTTVNSSDLEEDEVCCIDGGTCETDTRENCTEAGYFCMSGSSCTGDILIDDYYCANPFVCCSEEGDTCSEKSGVICYNGEVCANGTKINASDIYAGETCCGGDGHCVSQSGDDYDCEESGYYCMPGIDCEGELLYDYSCAGISKCCDTETSDIECEADKGGTICRSDEVCSDGEEVKADDIYFGETCCVGGTCKEEIEEKDYCEDYGGTCRTECESGEEEAYYDCEYGGGICCIESSSSGGSLWWLWILLIILIIAVALGIVFKDKLRPYYNRFFKKSKPKRLIPPFGNIPPRKGQPLHQPSMGRTSSGRPPMRHFPRRIMPPSPRPPQKPKPSKKESSQESPSKKSLEIDDVLKKLKDISK